MKFADYFGMALGPVETVDLADYMADKEAVWQRVVEKHALIRNRSNGWRCGCSHL